MSRGCHVLKERDVTERGTEIVRADDKEVECARCEVATLAKSQAEKSNLETGAEGQEREAAAAGKE